MTAAARVGSVDAARVVILGGGQAGGEVAANLRQQGYQGSITLIGEEPYLPYRRPPLSKAFLADEATLDSLTTRSAAVYRQHRIDCRMTLRAEAIDRAARRVHLSDGSAVGYDSLVLATGGRPRRLALPGAEHSNVHYVRGIDDVLRLKRDFTAGARVVIIGGGYIGLEVASVAIKKGLVPAIVESAPRLLARVTSPEVSMFYERVHRARGVDVRTNVGVRALAGEGRVHSVELTDGERLPADVVIVGIGSIPNVELAQRAGLEVNDGIVVDAGGQTGDPAIWAVGDCARQYQPFYGRALRLESIPNLTEQARVVAANLCGKPATYAAVPWFWSDQYDLKLQMTGLSQGYEEVIVRGEPQEQGFVAIYLRQAAVIAVDVVNRPRDFMAAKRLVAQRAAAHEVDSFLVGR